MTTSVRLATPPRRWLPRGDAAADPRAAVELAHTLELPESLCRLLVQRGHADPAAAKRFLRPRRDQLEDPFRLADMEAAVARLRRALRDGEPILVHGDYDVDGICAAALYTRALRRLGARVEAFVPERADGYDLGSAGLRAAARLGASLILTGDCGIVAHEAVREAGTSGIDVVVTDHHTPGSTLPAAAAVVNPRRADCGYPFPELSGAGIAFKVCQALTETEGADPEPLWYDLDLVGLATIADVVPLTGENRVLAHYGLRVLARSRNPGLRALVRTAGLEDRDRLTAVHVSHVLAPRINAAGRVGVARQGLDLLLSETEAEAAPIAERLEEDNRRRRDVESETLAVALATLERDYDASRDYAVVLDGAGWHPGVIGIVASRVVERIHRPAVLIARRDGAPARGSARSIRGFHIHAALEACAGLLERYGGHRHAAGLEIRSERIGAFREALNAHARSVLSPDDLYAAVEYDLELRLGSADEELCRYMEYVEPCGAGNPSPVFVARGVTVAGYPRVVGRGHAKLRLAQDGVRLEAIGFDLADRLAELDVGRRPLDVAFRLQTDRWNGRSRLQARLLDFRPAE